jgi:hypothetical protein
MAGSGGEGQNFSSVEIVLRSMRQDTHKKISGVFQRLKIIFIFAAEFNNK